MAPRYTSFDPAAEINGESIRSVLATFEILQQGRRLLEQQGLPAEPQAGHWYPMQSWLNVLGDLEAYYGPDTLYHVGLQVVNNSVFPPNLDSLPAAMQSLNVAYQLNVRGQGMGYYRVEDEQAQYLCVRCHTPNPVEFERGIIMGLARRFRPLTAASVEVTTEPVSAELAHTKLFRVSW